MDTVHLLYRESSLGLRPIMVAVFRSRNAAEEYAGNASGNWRGWFIEEEEVKD